jgi:hypothetical protein
MRLAQQVSDYWRQLGRRIWPSRIPARRAKPDQDHAVEDENLRGALPGPRGLSDPRVIEALMNMRCC